MKTKFTPGPWHVQTKSENFYGINSKDGNVCILAAGDNKRIDKLANAQLIAAAPDLLEALMNCLDAVGVEEREQLEALIAKATGSKA